MCRVFFNFPQINTSKDLIVLIKNLNCSQAGVFNIVMKYDFCSKYFLKNDCPCCSKVIVIICILNFGTLLFQISVMLIYVQLNYKFATSSHSKRQCKFKLCSMLSLIITARTEHSSLTS